MKKISISIIGLILLAILSTGVIWFIKSRSGVSIGRSSINNYSDCSKKLVEADQYADTALVASGEPASFVTNRIITDHLEVYTNAKVIEYQLALRTWGDLAIENTSINASGKYGAVRAPRSRGGLEILSSCTGRTVVITFEYELSDQMLQQNLSDEVTVQVNVDGQEYKRQFNIHPAIWTKPTFSTNANPIVGSTANYQAATGQEVAYIITLKNAAGQPLIDRLVSFKQPDKGYATPTIVLPFSEVAPGDYQTVVTADTEMSLDMGIVIKDGTPNPDYNVKKLVFTNQVTSKGVNFPEGIQFSFDKNYKTNDGSPFMFLAFIDRQSKFDDRTIKRVMFDELDESSLSESAAAFPSEIIGVRQDGLEVALMNKNYSPTIRLMKIDAVGRTQWPDEEINLNETVQPVRIFYTPDGTKIVIQAVKGLYIIDVLQKKLLTQVPFSFSKPSDLVVAQITNSNVIAGTLETDTYNQEAEITIETGTNNSNMELKPVDSSVKNPAVIKKIDLQSGKVVAEKIIHDDALRILGIAEIPADANRFYVMTGTVQELSGSWCKTYPIFSPGVTNILEFDTNTLEPTNNFTLTVPMDNYGVYLPKQFIYGNGKLYFGSLLQSKDCNQSDEDILRQERLYEVSLGTKQASMITALLTNRSRTIITDSTDINESFFITGKYFIHLDRVSASEKSQISQLFTFYSL